jgi:hypothetical protein
MAITRITTGRIRTMAITTDRIRTMALHFIGTAGIGITTAATITIIGTITGITEAT